MIKRNLKIPETSFFLFGPRGTGKTTWLKDGPIDVLPVKEFLVRLSSGMIICKVNINRLSFYNGYCENDDLLSLS